MGTRRHRRRGARALIGLCFLAMLGMGTPAHTLEPDRRLSQYNHEIYRSEHGLPQNSVLASAQTSDGYLWFGTYEGLARFDGVRFTVFDRRTSPELREQEITALAEDASGLLWVGTSQGIFVYESGQLRRPAQTGDLAESRITALAVDGTFVWISSSQGLVRAPASGKGAWQRYTSQEGMLEGGTGSIAVAGAGGIWVGTRQGLARVSGDKVEPVLLPKGLTARFPSLWMTRDGMLWIGMREGLLLSLREGVFTEYGPKQGLPKARVTELLEDRDGNLWVGTERGMARRNASGFSAFTSSKDLAEGQVRTLFEDREGHLWVGLGGEGLHRLSNGPFLPLGEPEGLTLNSPSKVFEAHDGTMWVVMGGRLERMKDGVGTQLGPAQGLPGDAIFTLAESSDGALWVGTRKGAYRYDGQRFVALGPETGMPPNVTVWAMIAEPGGGLWLATEAGLAWLSGGRVTLYDKEGGLTSTRVTAMQREVSGTIWMGSYSGLIRFSQGAFTTFTSKDGLASDVVYSLYTGSQGTLWVGTSRGVTRLKDGRFSRITAAQGLPDDTVFTLLPDSEGFFWMSSNKGVVRVSRRELEEVADGRRQRVNGWFFDDRDGMRVGECNGGDQYAGWKTRDGKMWFANLQGVVMVNPKDARLQPAQPQVRIEDVRVQGQPVPLGERLELAPGQQDLDIRFTAFVANGAQRVPFRYRLEGHDTGWVDAEGRRVATYTRLLPGTYRFQVEAQDRRGNWLEPGAVLEVELQPWFYQAAWFYVLCALGVCGVAASGYAWRVGRLKKHERWLQARVEERTKELARANSELDAHLRTLRATQAQLVQAGKMAAVGTLAAGVGHEINNPLSYIISNLEHSCEEAEMLERVAESSEPVRERLRDMQQVLREALMGADRVRRIVRDLKTFSRQDEDARGPVDLRAVMDSAAKMAAGELRPRAQLVRDYAPDVPPVEGNEARLAQVFLNLLINAAQALPEGKSEQNEVRLALMRGGEGQVVAEVRDTGSGIPPEVLGRIFDPFFTTKPVGVGTGLGLALCQAFVASMGGRIEVESQIGRGSLFRVTLPMASGKQEREPRSTPAQSAAVERGRVLVVDDDPLVSSALRRTLARDHEVEVVVSSRRALELLTSPQGGFDVILCDLMMPEMTGMELHAQLVAASPDLARRMVFITGGAYTPAAREFLERVDNPRVEKPFDPEKLREQVQEWVRRAHSRITGQAA